MKEDNQPVKELSHLSKIEMFPKGRSEYQKPKLSHEIRQTSPLTDNTRQVLTEIADRQYKTTTYMDNYLDPRNRDNDGNFIAERSKEEEENEKSKLYKLTQNLREDEQQGKWPGWPASTNKKICKQTGRVMEKTDVESADDKDDQRKIRFLTKKPGDEKTQLTEREPYARADLIPMSNFYLCGCGPYTTGIRNTKRDLDARAYDEKAEIAAQAAKAAAIKEPFRHLRGEDTLMFDKNRHPYQPTDHRDKFKEFQREIGDRWRNHMVYNKPPDYFLPTKQGFSLSTADERAREEAAYSKRGSELTVEDSKDEDATVKAALDGDPGYSFQNYNSHPTNADRVTTQSGTLPPDYSGPSTVVPSLINPADWLDHLKRKDKNYTTMIESTTPIPKYQQEHLNKMEEQRLMSADRKEIYSSDEGKYTAHLYPNTLYYSPEIKVSKNRMLEAEGCEGVSNSLRYWLPFKAISSQRIQFTNQDTMPDWRDTQRKLKKDMYLEKLSRFQIKRSDAKRMKTADCGVKMKSPAKEKANKKAIIECKFEDGRSWSSLFNDPAYLGTGLIKHTQPRPKVLKPKGACHPISRNGTLLMNQKCYPANSSDRKPCLFHTEDIWKAAEDPEDVDIAEGTSSDKKADFRQHNLEEEKEHPKFEKAVETEGVPELMTVRGINDIFRAKYTLNALSILPTVKKVVGSVPPRETDPGCWSLHLKRRGKRLSDLVDSTVPVLKQFDKRLENMKEERKVASTKIENYIQEKARFVSTNNPESVYYCGPIKLPPTKLVDALDYEGSGCNHRYGLPFKTVANKRYWLTHPEPIPDLRECQRKFKKEDFLGYHSSVFR